MSDERPNVVTLTIDLDRFTDMEVGSICHDLNNLGLKISGYAHSRQRIIDEGKGHRESLEREIARFKKVSGFIWELSKGIYEGFDKYRKWKRKNPA